MEHEHTVEAIHERLASGPRHNYLRDWIYGGIDGSVTTLAVVTGVVGARLSSWVIVVMGLANLFGDGFSMAASNFLGTRAEHEDLKRIAEIEYRHVELAPEGEREEVRQIFRKKGFAGEDLKRLVDLITADRTRWVETMLTEEYGLPQQVRSPWIAAISTFAAFLVCGTIPLLPYLLRVDQPVVLSVALTAIVFFAIGSVKSKWSMASWWKSGVSTLVVGSIAATLAYAAGVVLNNMAQR
jgi:VIT1/CCC1 family predicted Fe2+/Mn2+ transporter